MQQFPYKEMADIGWVTYPRKPRERTRELRRFFGVASLRQVPHIDAYAPAFRYAKGKRPIRKLWLLGCAAANRTAEQISLPHLTPKNCKKHSTGYGD